MFLLFALFAPPDAVHHALAVRSSFSRTGSRARKERRPNDLFAHMFSYFLLAWGASVAVQPQTRGGCLSTGRTERSGGVRRLAASTPEVRGTRHHGTGVRTRRATAGRVTRSERPSV